MELTKIEKLILDYLKKQKEPVTIYQIHKGLKDKIGSWSTIRHHLYSLYVKGFVDKIEERTFTKRRLLWKVKG